VLSALGHVTDSPPDLLAAASSNVIAAMRAHGDRRLVVLAPPSVEDQQDRRGLSCRFVRLAMPVMMRAATRDHKAQSRLVKDSGLDWTIARGAGVFTDGPHTGRYHAGPITPAADRRVSRADLADVMLAAASNGKFLHSLPLVSQ
jgi:putative NADH-flavin reductase